MSMAVIHQGDSEMTKWLDFEQRWRIEHPSSRDFAFVRSHRAPSRIDLPWLINITLAGLAAFALMTYGVVTIAMAGVPVMRLLPALAAVMLSGVACAVAATSRQLRSSRETGSPVSSSPRAR